MKLDKSSFYDSFVYNLKKQKSFTLTGLTSFSRLLLLKYIKEITGKKVLFITSTEQASLRYSVDYEKLFDEEILQEVHHYRGVKEACLRAKLEDCLNEKTTVPKLARKKRKVFKCLKRYLKT